MSQRSGMANVLLSFLFAGNMLRVSSWVVISREGVISFLGPVSIDTTNKGASLSFSVDGTSIWKLVTALSGENYGRGELNFVVYGTDSPALSLQRDGTVIAPSSISAGSNLAVGGKLRVEDQADFAGNSLAIGNSIKFARLAGESDSSLLLNTTIVQMNQLSISRFAFIGGPDSPTMKRLPALSIMGSTALYGPMSVQGIALCGSTGSVSDFLMLGSGLFVEGECILRSELTVLSKATVGSNSSSGLSVSGTTHISGSLSLQGVEAVLAGAVQIIGNASVSSKVSVAGDLQTASE